MTPPAAMSPSDDALARATEALERLHDYFDQRADADAVGDPMRYQGNAEMYLLRDCDEIAAALAAARAQGAAEAFERAAVYHDDKAHKRDRDAIRYDNNVDSRGRHNPAKASAAECRKDAAEHREHAAAIRALAKEAK